MFRKLKENEWDCYVGKDVAFLLKQKGFVGNGNIGCTCGVYCLENKKLNIFYDDVDNFEVLGNECLRPTQQASQKWLRDMFDIHIDVLPWYVDEKEKKENKKRWVCKVYKSYGMVECVMYTNETPTSYEEGLEIAIKHSLEKLV